MKAEPTLNEMCEYIEMHQPKGYSFSISQYIMGHMDLFIHFPNKECDRKTSFKSIKGLVEYLFNYYFAVNNK